jgi:hypothetical protein
MPIDLRLLTSAIDHHAQELYRLLDVKCEHAGTPPQHTRVLLVALFDYLNAEGKLGSRRVVKQRAA